VLIAFFSLLPSGDAAGKDVAVPKGPPLDQKLLAFDLDDGALIDGLSQLSLQKYAKLHVGFEEIIRDKIMDPRDRTIRFTLHLSNVSVRDVLDELCQHDLRYAWSVDGQTVNVYPRNRLDDSAYLPNVRVERITLTGISNPNQALTPLWKQLPNEQIGYMQMGGDNSYENPWNVTFEHLTVRQLANRIAEHMGPHTAWVWQGGKNERMFTFLKGGFQTDTREPSTK
jgi:hypothetical protein